ncbi:MAG: bifunctional 5,10-methylenetetrahydrofolate dehydrogenase/5,10-methenyltetrahydrofolate cyclohydrolase [Candidatus Omnitrophota bacterium]|nr:bifunctional 5,10-methylenetetrahydrofolate dehydrogenase/5,10-methenyltetrahydrofolate cyclohydrolase [Candidatus Omnitrophota bacterium]
MPARLLNGKALAEKIKARLRREVAAIKKRCGRVPLLSVIQIGRDKAAAVYINSQERIAKQIGIGYRIVRFGSLISQENLIRQIEKLNKDKRITAIMLGLPLPKRLDLRQALCSIDPKKNVEKINPTASAVMELLISTGISLFGREAVVVGHGDLVGKPIAMSLLDKLATVTVCHIGTAKRGNLRTHIGHAEILVVAVGKPNIIKGSWVKRGSIVVDVGINKVGDKIVGDVEFEAARRRASFITPVPGGVGPLTVMMSMRNCVELFKKQMRPGR